VIGGIMYGVEVISYITNTACCSKDWGWS